MGILGNCQGGAVRWRGDCKVSTEPAPRANVVEYQEETPSRQVLTYDHSGAVGTWAKSELPPAQALHPPTPLFKKLDESVVGEEHARLEG